MKLLNLEEYTKENPIEFDGSNIYQDIPTEAIKAYSEYLAETISSVINYNEYLNGGMNNIVDYVEFIKRSDDLSFKEWSEIKKDGNKLKIYKRDKTINEIIEP